MATEGARDDGSCWRVTSCRGGGCAASVLCGAVGCGAVRQRGSVAWPAARRHLVLQSRNDAAMQQAQLCQNGMHLFSSRALLGVRAAGGATLVVLLAGI